MSMQHYALYDYGLYLDYDALKHMSSKIFEDYTEEAFEDDDWRFLNALYDQGYVEYSSEFTGEAIAIRDNGEPMWGIPHEVYSYDTLWYVPVKKVPRLIGTVYQSMDEVVTEFRDRLGKFLPDDYDYRKNLCVVCGTYFG